jgi:hypothetical protein
MDALSRKDVQDTASSSSSSGGGAGKDERELLEWAARQVSSVPGRKMLARTGIRRMEDGKEQIWVEYLLNEDVVAEHVTERDERKNQYWHRENEEIDWDELIIDEVMV